jgi:hypothetical protein
MLPNKKQPARDWRKIMEKLRKQVEKENRKELKKAISNLNKAKKEDFINLWYYSEKLTKRQKEKRTKSEQKEIIKNEIIKEYDVRLKRDLKRIDTIENANDNILSITINIDWVKNRTWGYNPHATIYTNNGDMTEGRASGCGYDKESTAIAEALNKNNDILKLLYTFKNKKMTAKKTNNHDILGYGSGYGVLPYFEGGVGASSLLNIFRKLGYSISEHHTEKSDFYTITSNN